MNVDTSPNIVTVRPGWTFGATLGLAFPLGCKRRAELDGYLAKLAPRMKKPGQSSLA